MLISIVFLSISLIERAFQNSGYRLFEDLYTAFILMATWCYLLEKGLDYFSRDTRKSIRR